MTYRELCIDLWTEAHGTSHQESEKALREWERINPPPIDIDQEVPPSQVEPFKLAFRFLIGNG